MNDQCGNEIAGFIDKFISCSLDGEIGVTAGQVQRHVHTQSCRKYGTKCRFNFPRFPSEKTFITYPLKRESFETEKEYNRKKLEIQEILENVRNIIESLESLSNIEIEDILGTAGISKESYYEALKFNGKGTGIILRRKVNEVFINNYNPEWLHAWDANMDLQVCLDYFAILTYITDYYSKDDTGTMNVLRQVAKQCRSENLTEQMKCLAHAFLSHRQIGECEAVYRILPNLHLTESNIKCIFLANGFPDTRSRFLSKVTENTNIKGDN